MTAGPGPLHLVFGASGYIGTNLVPCLQAAGKRVRATARNHEVLEARAWQGVDLVAADALRPETLATALQDVEVAFYLVHSMAAGSGFGALDREAAHNFGRAAAAAGVRRIVYLGGLMPDGAKSEHLRSRAETGEVLRQSGVPVTELRAGMIIGPGSAAYEVIRDLVNHLPMMITPRWVRSRSTPIALDDLLAYLVAIADIDAAAGQVLDAGGGEVVTYEQIMRCYGRRVGKYPVILPVPVLSPGLSSLWLRLITSVPVGIAKALVQGLEHDFVARDAELRRLVPRATLGMEAAIAAACEADARHAVVARWVEGSIACRNYRPEYSFYAKRAGAITTGPRAGRAGLRHDLQHRGRGGLVFRRCALVRAPRAGLAVRWAQLPPLATAPHGTARGRRRRFVAGHRGRARPPAHADDGNEGAGRGRARVRHAAAGRRRQQRFSHCLLASGRGLGAALLVRARACSPVHLSRPDASHHATRKAGVGGTTALQRDA